MHQMEGRSAQGEALTTNWVVGWSCDLELVPMESWAGAVKNFLKRLDHWELNEL